VEGVWHLCVDGFGRAAQLRAARNFEVKRRGKFSSCDARDAREAGSFCAARLQARPMRGDESSRLWRRAPSDRHAARLLSRPVPLGARHAQERADERAEQSCGGKGVGIGEGVEQGRQEHRCSKTCGQPAKIGHRAPGPAARGLAQKDVGRHRRHQPYKGQGDPRRHVRHETPPMTVHGTNFPLAWVRKWLGDSQRESMVRKRKDARACNSGSGAASPGSARRHSQSLGPARIFDFGRSRSPRCCRIAGALSLRQR